MFSYSASGAWPQLFPSHRRIPVQTKRNIADEQMCFKNGRSTRPPVCRGWGGGVTHQHGSRRMRLELDANTRGATQINTCMNSHVQTLWQRYAETCVHTRTILNLSCPNHKREMTPNWKDALLLDPNSHRYDGDMLIQSKKARDTASFTAKKREEYPFRHILFWSGAYQKAFPATRSHSSR